MKRGKTTKSKKISRIKKLKDHPNTKKIVILLILIGLITISFLVVIPALKNKECTSIQSGLILDSEGNTITTGYDKWGYNYQGNVFRGFLDNTERPEMIVTSGDLLTMKWNDAWLSNLDCDGDNLLDAHYGFPTYAKSNAWLRVRSSGEYELNGGLCSWSEYYKIIAVPKYAVINDGFWYLEDKQLGAQIADGLILTRYTLNDPCGMHTSITEEGEFTGLGFF